MNGIQGEKYNEPCIGLFGLPNLGVLLGVGIWRGSSFRIRLKNEFCQSVVIDFLRS